MKRTLRFAVALALVTALASQDGPSSAHAQAAGGKGDTKPADKPKPNPDALKAKPGPPKPAGAPKPIAPPKPPTAKPPITKPPAPVPASPEVKPPPPKSSGLERWVESTPDQLVAQNLKRAESGADDAIAGLLLATTMTDFASPGEVARGLAALAKSKQEIAVDAAGLLAAISPPAFGKTWTGWANVSFEVPEDANGFVRAATVIGPFKDTGGGLPKKEGPEADGASFAAMDADYSWGDFEVTPRRVVPDWITGSGVPLETYISPRQESCTYTAARVSFPSNPASVVLRVASTGSARVIWDGQTLIADDHVNSRAALDRFALEIEGVTGDHLVAVKTCSTALRDDGLVRIRFTDPSGQPVRVNASSDLKSLPKERAVANAGTAKFTVRKTLATRALDNEGASLDHAIAAAIVRAQGGADDSRSPRVTGLLDRITKDAAVTPNQLALSGWLSNFGANKSAWLNLAMERGRDKSDTSTASFAQRRLAEALIAGGAQDAAMRVMEKEPMASENDVSLRVMRAGVVGRTRSTLDAYQLLANLDIEFKQKIPTVALRELASAAISNPEARLSYLRRLAQTSNSARGEALVFAASIDGNQAFERTIAQVIPYGTSARTLVGYASSLERRERPHWARELAFVATNIGPNVAEAWETLATTREAVLLVEQKTDAPKTEDAAHANRARERALALRRGDASKKAEIAFRDGVFEGKKSNAKDKGADEAFLVESSVILERAKKTPAKVGEAFERNIHFQRVVTYNDDQRVSQLIHQAREIVVEPRTQQELYERNIPAEGDEVELVFARVHRKDGTVAQPEEQSSVGAYIKWPQLRTGDIVEYAVRGWTSQPVGRRGDPPFYFIDYVGATSTRPVLFNEVVVVSPEGQQLGVDVINGKADRTVDKIEGGKRILAYTWDNPPIIADEPMSPSVSENVPIVVGSTFRSWDDFRSWYRGAIEGFSEPDDQVKRLAAELTKDKKTEKEKLEALFNYVADDIRYVNYQSGEYWLPNRPQICLSRKQGDCDDKAILLIALLKVIGVNATPVLVQTRMTAMPSVLLGTKAAAPLFDHGIAYIPGKNGSAGQWLDATSPESRIGPLPSMDARAKALFIYDGEAKIIDTPPGNVNENGVSLKWDVTLDAEGGASIRASEKHLGDWAFELRRNLKEEDARAQYLEGYLSRWLPTLDLPKEGITYAPDTGAIGYNVKAQGFARNEGDEWAIASLGNYSLMSNYASLSERTLPVVLPPYLAPSHQRRTITITAPKGFKWKALPPGGEAKGGGFGSAKVSFKEGKANSIVIDTEVVFDKSTIPVSEYAAFRKWLEGVDALVRQSVRYVPEGSTVKTTTPAKPAATPAKPTTPAKPAPAKPAAASAKPVAPAAPAKK